MVVYGQHRTMARERRFRSRFLAGPRFDLHSICDIPIGVRSRYSLNIRSAFERAVADTSAEPIPKSYRRRNVVAHAAVRSAAIKGSLWKRRYPGYSYAAPIGVDGSPSRSHRFPLTNGVANSRWLCKPQLAGAA